MDEPLDAGDRRPDATPAESTEDDVAHGPMLLLAVVSDLEIAHLLGTVLRHEGRQVEVVRSAAEAWRVLGSRPVDLVVMDLVLPDTDGRKFLMRLRERRDTAAIPVVVLSARDDSIIKSECFALGADGFFAKPVDPETLDAFVTSEIERAHASERDAHEDAVTGLLNRAGLLERASAMDPEDGVALVLVEIDDFDELSHRLGRAGGAGLLVEAAAALERGAPEGSHLARWEGAEFLLVLQASDPAAGRAAAERALRELRALRSDGSGPAPPVTASAGVAAGPARELFDAVLEHARYQLFRARAAGGDRLGAERAPGERHEHRILIAEDDPSIALLLETRLEQDGFEVEIHGDGTSAYEALERARPDLLILDVRMPGMDGFELLSKVRSVPDHADLPVMMLTGMGREADLVRGFELGADDYIVKPFSPTELLARMRRLLQRKATHT